MGRQHFFFKLIPPRVPFPGDVTADEAAIMQQHAQYLLDHQAAGIVLIAGPVFAAERTYGMAVLAVEDAAMARAFCDADPSVHAGLNTYEVSPMRVLEPSGTRSNGG
jgi:uncharacterized protein YciI